MSDAPTLKPGDETPRTDLYEVIGPRGGRTGIIRRSVMGNPMPPTPKPRQRFESIAPDAPDRAAPAGDPPPSPRPESSPEI